MTKDEVKSLVNSVNMIKNMVESIVAAVQERFKDYDEVVVSLKARIQHLEDGATGAIQPGTQISTSDSFEQVTKLEKRLDSLNERILLIEAARSVHQESVVEPTDVQAFKDVAVKETQPEIVEMPEAPIAPPPTPEIVTPEPKPEPVTEPVLPTVEAPSIPTPTPPPATRATEPEVEPISKAPAEIPAPAAIPKPATQVTETGERDVSPISKEVSGAIPAPPKQDEPVSSTEVFQPPVAKTEPDEASAPEEKKSAELFGEAVSGDKAELLKALKKLEDL